MAQEYSVRTNKDNIDGLARGTMASDSDNSKAIPFKICLIGNSNTGKTCIVERYVNGQFKEKGANTLSAAFNQKILTVQPDGFAPTKVKMQIWDTAGAEEYKAINKLYYQKAAIILLVYSTSDYESFDSLQDWAREVDENAEQKCIKFVVGAKSDDTEAEETVPKSVGVEFAKRLGATYFLTSAKTNSGISNLF